MGVDDMIDMQSLEQSGCGWLMLRTYKTRVSVIPFSAT
jgi:hypothetical protein